MSLRPAGERGFTYLEMVATAAIIMILASAIMPLARVTHRRVKEIELRRNLRIIRNAIDAYHKKAAPPPEGTGEIGGTDVKIDSFGYPPDLETLVKGVTPVGRIDFKLKFLRRIPVDPMTGNTDWGIRSYQDDPDSLFSGSGNNVYDVFSKSPGKALDGTMYKDW